MTTTNRPHFRLTIEQIKLLVTASLNDLNKLKVIQYELSFRKVPTSRALKIQVDERVLQLAKLDSLQSIQETRSIPQYPMDKYVEPYPTMPIRVSIDCANCRTPNFVTQLEGIVQHLSCSSCKSPYEAQFKYGVMRTTFQAKSEKSSDSSLKWMFVALALMIMLVILVK